MLNENRRFLSLFALVFTLVSCVTESNAQQNLPESERERVRSSFDPDAPPEARIPLAPYLKFGAQLEFEYTFGRNIDLDSNQDEDLSSIVPELSLAFSFDPCRYFEAFLTVTSAGELNFKDRNKVDDKFILEIEQAYLLFKNLIDKRFSLQIGRQRFDDERQWLYDAELDAARAFSQFPKFLIELSASRGGLVRRDLINVEKLSQVDSYIAYGTYAIADETYVAPYVLIFNDRSEEQNSPFFFGIHSDGELTDRLDYWLELAYVGGKEGSDKIRGVGFDLGSTYVFNRSLEPSITLGYAFGSEGFRQTGLEANESDFNGVVDFRYYGELLNPELSNLSIFTAGTGIEPTERSSVDLIYHYYLQSKASSTLREVEIDAAPEGNSRRLGNEIDLVIGYGHEGSEMNFELALALGYFIPGAAFPSDAVNSFLTRLVIQFEF